MDFDAMSELGVGIVGESEDLREELLSMLTAVAASGQDSYISRLLERVEKTRLRSLSDIVGTMQPRGSFFSRDSTAMSGGMKTPPHIALAAMVSSVEDFFRFPERLADVARQAAGHIGRRSLARKELGAVGTKIFIGHGGSSAWRDLKDFLQDRLGLEWDEFNRVSIAGVANSARLSEMLKEAQFAFLVMTGEDETKDGKTQARMNVVHEAGLFQGRLGFTKAIILLEEGCEEFTNIQGLGQIRFPAGNIKQAFEEIRKVLEREGVIEK
jgi:predicted nucleotide-binding protein with TIR-like domain